LRLLGQTPSTNPRVAITRPTCGLAQALEVGQDAAPPSVLEVTAGGSIQQLSQHPTTSRRGIEDGSYVVLDRHLRADVADADRSVLDRAALL